MGLCWKQPCSAVRANTRVICTRRVSRRCFLRGFYGHTHEGETEGEKRHIQVCLQYVSSAVSYIAFLLVKCIVYDPVQFLHQITASAKHNYVLIDRERSKGV